MSACPECHVTSSEGYHRTACSRLELDPLSPLPQPRSAPSHAYSARGRGIGFLHGLASAESDYAAHRIAHLERRLTQRENVVSDMADEIARLRGLLGRVSASLADGTLGIPDVCHAAEVEIDDALERRTT